MRTSNKIWTVYLSLFGVLVIVVSVLNVRAFRQAQEPVGAFCNRFVAVGDSIRVVNIGLNKDVRCGKVYFSVYKSEEGNNVITTRDDLAGNAEIVGDTLYLRNQRGINIRLPNVEHVIINGEEKPFDMGGIYISY